MIDLTLKFVEFKNAFLKAHKILMIAHRKPDGDSLGANLALTEVFEHFGKEVHLACVDKPAKRYNYLRGINRFIQEFEYKEYDLIVICDAGAHYMTNYHEIYPGILSGTDVPIVNIDHHASNELYGTINIVDVNSASTTVIVYKFINFLDHTLITPTVATALMTGIYNDTGSLMHSNTTLDVLRTAGDLAKRGAKTFIISKHLFRNTPLSTMRLWGRVFENIKVNHEGVAMSVVTDKDFKDCGAIQDELSGVVDVVNSIPNIKFSVVLNEDGEGHVKGSFRTPREDVDLSEIAGVFGGGGHRKAAGFNLPGKVEKEVRWKIVSDEKLVDVNRNLLQDGNAD